MKLLLLREAALCAVIILLSATPALSDTEIKQLACFYFDAKNPNDGASFLEPGLPSVWAKDGDGNNVYAVGQLEDGFLVTSALYGLQHRRDDISNVRPLLSSSSLMNVLCRNGLKLAFPDSHQSKMVIHVGAKSSSMALRYYPVVLPEKRSMYTVKYDRIIVFGDSLSDTGNLQSFLKIFPRDPHTRGRFSNGPIWIDYLQLMTNIPVQNWAVGGSMAHSFAKGVLSKNSLGHRVKCRAQKFTSGHLRGEIRRFERKSLQGEKIKNPDTTLFSLWIGGNDYLLLAENEKDANIFLDQPDHDRIGYKTAVEQITDDIIKNLTTLYELGARHFLVANLPDLGLSPRILNIRSYHQHGFMSANERLIQLSEKVTALTDLHNERLHEKLKVFKKEHDGVEIIFVNAAKAERRTRSSLDLDDGVSPFDYDFDKKSEYKISNGKREISIYNPCIITRGLKSATVCADPQRAKYWDMVHPTSYGHCLMAAKFHNAIAKQGGMMPVTFKEYIALCRPELLGR